MDLVDRLWFAEQRDPIATNGGAGSHARKRDARDRRRATDWLLRYNLELLKPNYVGDFADLAANLPLSNLADRLSMTDVGLQVLATSPLVRAALAKEIDRLDHAPKDARLPEVARLLLDCDRPAGEKFIRCHHVEGYAVGFHVHTGEDGEEHVAIKHQRERCWLRICPKCARDIAARLRLRYSARLAAVQLHKPRGFTFKHWVLTAPRGREGRDLRADLELLHKATKKLAHKFWTDVDGRAGVVAAFEIGPRGGNVHVHLIAWGPFALHADVRAYWEKATNSNGEWRDVHFDPCTPEEAVAEVLKYAVKFGKSAEGEELISSSDLVAVHLALKGKRRVWAWGALYGMCEEERGAEEDVERDAGGCEECHAPMLWARVAELRWLLGLSRSIASIRESKCIAETATPGAAMLQGGSGRACAPPGGALRGLEAE